MPLSSLNSGQAQDVGCVPAGRGIAKTFSFELRRPTEQKLWPSIV